MVFSGSFRQGKHQQILTHRLVLHPAHKLKDIVKKDGRIEGRHDISILCYVSMNVQFIF